MSTISLTGKATAYLCIGVKTPQCWERKGQSKAEIHRDRAAQTLLRLVGAMMCNGSVGYFPQAAPRPYQPAIAAYQSANAALRRQFVRQLRLPRLHGRLANIRKDTLHKLAINLTRRFETSLNEDLNVNEFWRQLQDKAAMGGGRRSVADRFYPSSETCLVCGYVNSDKVLGTDTWTCSECGVVHDCNVSVAINLERLSPPGAELTRGDIGP
jgi:hypothetical protein